MKKLKGELYKPGETPQNYSEEVYEQLPPGAYICKISLVRDEPEKEYLYLEYDISEGEHAGYYARLSDRANFWGGRLNLSYKDSNLITFKKAIKVINKANENYVFNPFADGKNADERTLVGKTFGIVLHEEEYVKNNGNVGTRMVGTAWTIIDDYIVRTGGEFDKRYLEKTVAKQRESQTTTSTPDFMDAPDNPFT